MKYELEKSADELLAERKEAVKAKLKQHDKELQSIIKALKKKETLFEKDFIKIVG